MEQSAHTNKIIVAIDGYSSSGKSTMARALAARIGYVYVDSGAMYRAVTLYAIRNVMVNPDHTINKERLIAALPEIRISFEAPGEDGVQHTLLNGEDVENEIRDMEVSNLVSPVAAIPEVRSRLTAMQQSFGKDKGIVMDGRDIGTTVFPDAELKIFLNASAQTRARRRWNELRAKGEEVTFEEVLENVEKRDNIDRTRRESPLRRADDAIDLDNSSMTIEEQDRWLTDRFNETLARL